jgi:hypothetical protein
MDISNMFQKFDPMMFAQEMAQQVYHEIMWHYIIYAIKIGMVAGLAMVVLGILLDKLHLNPPDLTTYTGCLITQSAKGRAPMIAGFIFHMIMSAVFGVIYLYIIYQFNIPATLVFGILLGVLHSIFSGTCMMLLDHINPCVQKKTLKPLGFAVLARGYQAAFIYTLNHILFATIMVLALGQ